MADINYTEIATAVENLREMARAVVAGLMTDGFTDREAHAITARVLSTPPSDEADPDIEPHCDLDCLACDNRLTE